MLSERIWSQIGCEEDGYLTVDTIGVAMGGGGMSASLRDLCRFGELMRCEGAWHGRQVIPAEVVADIRRGADPAKFAMAGYTLLPGYSYRNMWWVSHNPRRVRGTRHPRSAAVHCAESGIGDCALLFASDCHAARRMTRSRCRRSRP